MPTKKNIKKSNGSKTKETITKVKKATNKKKTTKKGNNTDIELPKLKKTSTTATKKNNVKKKTNRKKTVKTSVNKKSSKVVKESVPKKKEVTKEKKEEKISLYVAPTKEDNTSIEQGKAKKKLKYVKKKSNAKGIANLKKSAFLKKIKKFQRKVHIYGFWNAIPKKPILTCLGIIIVIIITCFSISLLKPVQEEINLDNISADIDGLKTLRFDINNTNDIIKSTDAYTSTLKEYYEYDFNTFNLTEDLLDEFRIFYNEKKKESFMVFKPISSREEDVASAIEKFYKEKKITYTKEEYDGYIFYISSSDDKKVISKIKQSQIKVFDILQELNKDEIEEKYGISSDLYKEYKVKTSMIVKQNVTEYLIFYPKNEISASKIESLMNEYYDKLLETWQDNEDNYNLIKNRYSGNYNGYLVYIISKDNDLVLQLIKK